MSAAKRPDAAKQPEAAKRPGVTPPKPPPPPKVRQRSLVLVNTGDGKGKSTAAFGVVMRGVARGWCVCVIQFIKSDKWKVGEEKVALQLGVQWLKGGDGFTWESPDLDKSEGRAAAAWQLAAATIAKGDHQLVVLDEITYPMNWEWIDSEAVLEAIRARPAHVNIIATGRDAPTELVEIADTVTEMVSIRHAYDRGIRARRGIDF
jgi:cob(I)alamin adenosyltransferase